MACRLLTYLLNNYMRQDRKPEAGKEKHSHAEHRLWISDRNTCSLVCFVLQCGPKRYLSRELVHFTFFLDRIVHLPVPSEAFTRRCKKHLKISESRSEQILLCQALDVARGPAAFDRRGKIPGIVVLASRAT